MAIEGVLPECGFTSFDFAISTEEAVGAARRKCPDIITTDVELRPGCGIAAVQTICSERPISVLFVTGTPGRVRAQMPGHPLIEKPFRDHHLVDAIKPALESRNG